MASVTIINNLYIHRLDDLSVFITTYLGAINEDVGITGEVRHYANGVLRAITTPGQVRRLRIDMPYMARPDLAVLQSWAGLPVMVRDPVGRKVFGVVFTVGVTDQPIGDAATVLGVSFDLFQLSLSEEV